MIIQVNIFMDDINPEDLISQLKAIPADSNKIARACQERPDLDKEEIENFVIQNSAKLIQDSLELIDNMKEVVHHMPEAENMSALSELVKASSGAIDTLNKIVLQDKKSNTTLKAKEMDIESRKTLQQSDQQHSLTMSREEIMAKLLNHKDAIDVDAKVKEPEQLN